MFIPSEYRTTAYIIVIDYIRQKETIHKNPDEVSLEYETGDSIPANTPAYCLVLHDRLPNDCYSSVAAECRLWQIFKDFSKGICRVRWK